MVHPTPLLPLPIDGVMPAVLDSLRGAASVVLRAPAGAGKTTRVPPAIWDSGLGGAGQILVLQPRRVAARAAARRITAERGGTLGDTIGYHVRFEREAGPQTRILVMTEGVLLRKLHDDPFLEQTSVVIFDEFHERNVYSDLALGMVRRLQQTVRPDLKIVVMSATLASEPIAEYLDRCPIVECEGRTFPVEIAYWRELGRPKLIDLAVAGIQRVVPRGLGDILVFLPGIGEIRRVADEIRGLAARHELAVMPLYGDLPSDAQDAVLRPAERRKLVLATNVAETSLTIDGITTVVDLGMARKLRFDPRVGLDRLELLPISQAAADQRAGRAGRTQPGFCLRMWEQGTHRHRSEFEDPEIRCIDLAGPVLQLHSWGERDVLSFPWFEAPRPESVARAELLLRQLGALDQAATITTLGRRLARFPLHPRIARLLVAGADIGCLPQAALAAALLSERDPFERGTRPTARQASATHSDVVDRVRLLEEFDQHRATASDWLKPGAANHVLRVRDQLLRECGVSHTTRRADNAFQREPRPTTGVDQPPNSTESPANSTPSVEIPGKSVDIQGPAEMPQMSVEIPGTRSPRTAFDASQPRRQTASDDELLMRALLAALPDRLAIRREPNSEKGLMVGGTGVSLHSQSGVLRHQLFICVDIEARPTGGIVRLASGVERDWLPPDGLRTADELFFHPSQKRVAARRRTYWEDLLLGETPTTVVDRQQAARILAKAAQADWDRVFPGADSHLQMFLNRVRCLGEWCPELGLPTLHDAQLHAVLQQLCATCLTFDELRQAPWLQCVRGLFDARQLALLDREAPERLQLPRGVHIKLDYQPGKPPILAVRIQDAFGLEDTPRIAGGRVPVLLHLLGPNLRPQQVTDDLASFWSNTYPRVRKELARRYPKHAWPENPRQV